MHCRCSEIESYKNEMADLSNKVSAYLSDAKGYADQLRTNLSNASDNLSDSIYCENLYSLSESLRMLNEQTKQDISELCNLCTQEYSRLSSTVSSLQSEDNAYHKMLAQQAALAQQNNN